jgi:predicted MFS family arabinose efflux permease
MQRSAADGSADLGSAKLLATAILLGVIGPEVFIVQPGFVQGLVEHLGFDDRGAGYTASAEMFGIAAVTVALTFFAHRLDWRRLLGASLAVMFAANVTCTFVHDLETFAVVRFLAGVGAGGVISLSFTVIGLTPRPDRNFGLLIMWVLTYGALGLFVMPSALDAVGIAGVLWFFALFPLLALPFLRHLPRTGEAAAHVEQDAVDLGMPLKSCALLAMFVYFLAQGAVWAYLFLIGERHVGLGEQQVASGLMISQVAGIGGAVAAVLLAHRLSRAVALAVGIAAGAVVLEPLVGGLSSVAFALAVSVYNFAWNFTQPIQLGAMASFDRRGRVVVYAVAAQMCGLAVGPFLAATVIEDGNLVPVIWLGIGLFAFSLVLFLPPVLGQARRSHGAVPI